jgi:hypothetical protein
LVDTYDDLPFTFLSRGALLFAISTLSLMLLCKVPDDGIWLDLTESGCDDVLILIAIA